MDEHSMSGCPTWGQLKHRCKDLRRPTNILYEAVNKRFTENTHGLPEVIYNRPWGVPVVYSSGDSAI